MLGRFASLLKYSATANLRAIPRLLTVKILLLSLGHLYKKGNRSHFVRLPLHIPKQQCIFMTCNLSIKCPDAHMMVTNGNGAFLGDKLD